MLEVFAKYGTRATTLKQLRMVRKYESLKDCTAFQNPVQGLSRVWNLKYFQHT